MTKVKSSPFMYFVFSDSIENLRTENTNQIKTYEATGPYPFQYRKLVNLNKTGYNYLHCVLFTGKVNSEFYSVDLCTFDVEKQTFEPLPEKYKEWYCQEHSIKLNKLEGLDVEPVTYEKDEQPPAPIRIFTSISLKVIIGLFLIGLILFLGIILFS